MRKKLNYAALAILSSFYLLTFCSPIDPAYGYGGEIDTSEEEAQSSKGAVYVAGIDDEDEKIVLFKDGEKILEYEVGDDVEVSSQPDMNHLIDGHIYSVFISDSQTIVKKDGKEMFRYNGRETIKGIYPLGENLFTLGQKCGAEGFSYRRNGKAILSRDIGYVLGGMYDVTYKRHGAIYMDNGSLCFCYFSSLSGGSSREEKPEWHIVKDGKDHTLSLPDKTSLIYDLRLVGGTVCYVGQDNYCDEPILHVGTQEFDFNFKKQTSGKDYRLNCNSGVLSFIGSFSSTKSGKTKKTTCCWSVNGQEYALDGNGFTIYSSADNYCYVKYEPQQITICSETKTNVVLNGKYNYFSCWNADYSNGIFRVVLNPSDKNGKPFLWEEGNITEFDLSGVLFGVEYY